METLANLESFVRSAEAGSFSVAARRLSLTPAAVSRNVAMLERNLGVRLFQRSDAQADADRGRRAIPARHAGTIWRGCRQRLQTLATDRGEPAGVLKVSMGLTSAQTTSCPLLPAFLARYPGIRPDWQFETRQIDLIAEGYDAAIGGGIELAPGVVSRTLAPLHIIAVASPAYLKGTQAPADPSGLAAFDGIVMRSTRTGRIRERTMRNAAGAEIPATLKETIVLDDPEAMCRAALLGLGVTLIAVPHALPHLERGALVRLCPNGTPTAGRSRSTIATRTLLPAKTRVFVDFVVQAFA